MKRENTPSCPDLTTVRKDPGIGYVSKSLCAICNKSGYSNSPGWGTIVYRGCRLLMCTQCKDERKTKPKKEQK